MSDSREIIAAHLPELDDQWRPAVERLVDVVLAAIPDAEHERKWGRLTFTREGDWHHWICAVAVGKTGVQLVLHKGALLADPDGVMTGDGKYTRSIRFAEPSEIDAEVVTPVLREAAERQTEM